MALVGRELSIVYGSVTVGAGTNYIIDGKFTLDKAYEKAAVAFEVVVAGSSEADFAAQCSALEVAFRIPRQRLRVNFNNTAHEDFNPTTTSGGNTGYNAVPTITKTGTQSDTGRSRRYAIRVEVETPADLSGQNGRRQSSVNLMTSDSGRRRLVVSGQYTSIGSLDARDKYNANILNYVGTLTSAFGGTWEGPFDEQATTDDSGKNLSFSMVWEELIFNQSVGVLDDLTLRRQKLAVSRSIDAPGDSFWSGSALRLETIMVEYECAVDKAQTQNLNTVYLTKVKPFLLQTAQLNMQGGAFALVSQDPRYDFVENRIACTMEILAVPASSIVSSTYRTDDSYNPGGDLVAAWEKDRMSKYDFQGPGTILRTITTQTRRIGNFATGRGATSEVTGGGGAGYDAGPFTGNVGISVQVNQAKDTAGGTGTGFTASDSPISPDGGQLRQRLLGRTTTDIPSTLGRPGEPQINVTDTTVVTRFAYYVAAHIPDGKLAPQATGPGSSPSPNSSPTGGATAPNPPATATGVG